VTPEDWKRVGELFEAVRASSSSKWTRGWPNIRLKRLANSEPSEPELVSLNAAFRVA